MPSTTPQTAVITPTRLLPERLPYLVALHESLVRQTDSTWQWILSLDGGDPGSIPDQIAQDPRVKVLALPKCGAAMTRNLALSLVDAPTVVFCDDDDILPSTSLSSRLRHLRTSGAAWVAGQIHNLYADGDSELRPSPVPVGWHEPGAVWAFVDSPQQPVPLGHTALMVETDYAVEVGGHGGFTQGEDYVYTASITGRAAGLVVPDVVYLYRDHANGQMTKGETYDLLEEHVRLFVMRQNAAIVRRAIRHDHRIPQTVSSAA
ncbi:glycosyltransferase family 2 protein [Streptomyces parvus]|uniref:glycosyltransferase family 2 protein n=1 Tax=Streptomyces parvus TaxID=66428 RepID=UPI002101D25D|nr:glycosyltransferase family A protein [Streptomyces parvus]MCQ1577165.1 glycosyltransferase family 2 protein [Streptomyces parvus]